MSTQEKPELRTDRPRQTAATGASRAGDCDDYGLRSRSELFAEICDRTPTQAPFAFIEQEVVDGVVEVLIACSCAWRAAQHIVEHRRCNGEVRCHVIGVDA